MVLTALLNEGYSVDCIGCGRKIDLSMRTYRVTGSILNRFIEKDLLFTSYGNGIALWVWVLGYWLEKPRGRASIPEKNSTVVCLVAFAKLRKAIISFVMSVCLSVCINNSAPTGDIFVKFVIWASFENLLGIPRFHYNLIRTAVLYKTYEHLR
jgi:hypothetical protein